MRYNIGDRVRIVDEFLPDSHDVRYMEKYLGTVVTITKSEEYGDTYKYWIEEDRGAYYWLEKTIAGYAYTITIEEFLTSKAELFINCDNEEDAKALCTALHNLGKKWRGGESYETHTHWDMYKSATCYGNHCVYSDTAYCERNGCKIYKFSEVNIGDRPIPKDAMQAFLRNQNRWIEVKYDADNDSIITRFGNVVRENNIIAIKNDPRGNYAKCSYCGEMIKNTPEDIAAHLAKKLDCVNCSQSCDEMIEDINTTYELQSDGTYLKNSKIFCKLYCTRSFSRVYANTPDAEGVCKYRGCSEDKIKPIGGFFASYPDAFDTMATVDALGTSWEYEFSAGNYYIYKHTGKTRIYAYVNKSGIIERFEYNYYDNTYEFVYSAKYNKLVWFSGYNYSVTPNSNITERNVGIITKIMKEIYEEKSK